MIMKGNEIQIERGGGREGGRERWQVYENN